MTNRNVKTQTEQYAKNNSTYSAVSASLGRHLPEVKSFYEIEKTNNH